jgi:hypothetical protein
MPNYLSLLVEEVQVRAAAEAAAEVAIFLYHHMQSVAVQQP